jgi:hypothetical protein
LGVDHDTAVPQGPIRSAASLLAHEAVFHGDDVVGERLAVEDVTEPVREGVVSVVADFEEPVFDAERIVPIVVELAAGDFYVPPVEVPAVEELDPIFRGGGGGCARRQQGERNKEPAVSRAR